MWTEIHLLQATYRIIIFSLLQQRGLEGTVKAKQNIRKFIFSVM